MNKSRHRPAAAIAAALTRTAATLVLALPAAAWAEQQTANQTPAFEKGEIASCDEAKVLETYRDSSHNPGLGSCPPPLTGFDKENQLTEDIKKLQCEAARERSCAYQNRFGSVVTQNKVNAAASEFKQNAPPGIKNSLQDDDLKNAIRGKMQNYARQFGCSKGVVSNGWKNIEFASAQPPYLVLNPDEQKLWEPNKAYVEFDKKLPELGDDKAKWDAYFINGEGARKHGNVLYRVLSNQERYELRSAGQYTKTEGGGFKFEYPPERPTLPVHGAYSDTELVAYMKKIQASEACKGGRQKFCKAPTVEAFYEDTSLASYQRNTRAPMPEVALLGKYKNHDNAYTPKFAQWRADYTRYRIAPKLEANRTSTEGIAKIYSTYEKGKNEKSLERLTVCSGKSESKGKTVIATNYEPCGSNMKLESDDNVYDFSANDFQKDPGFEKCLQNAKAAGMEIDKIIVQSSASRLPNTQAAAKKFCSHGFLALSCARATSTKNSVVEEFKKGSSGVFKDLTASGQDVESLITVNPFGSNGDGTSGADCPEELDADGKLKVKSEYAKGGAKRNELDQNKYVRVNIHFKPLSVKQTGQPMQFSYSATGCKEMEFACAR